MKEEKECQAFADWLDLQGLKFTHIANENGFSWMNRKTAMILGAKTKRMGMRKGIPDFVILTSKGTLWVEMKRPKQKLKTGSVMEGWKDGQKTRGGLKRAQYDWIKAINQTPKAQAEVCYGADEAIAFVKRILNNDKV